MGIALAMCAGCGEVTTDVPPDFVHQMVIHAALNPDSTRQRILVSATDYYSKLLDVSIAIHRQLSPQHGNEWEQVASWDSVQAAAAGRPLRDLWPCALNDGLDIGVPDWVCMTPEVALEPGGVYRVEARARDRDPASGVTRVMGDFSVEHAVVSGPDESAELVARWTPSVAAHRYILSLRKRPGVCANCADGWHADVDTTAIALMVPAEAIGDAYSDPMTLDVMALDEHLHAFLTTGNRGMIFSVPPIQNVVGGYGVVGSMRFRERRVDRIEENANRP